MLFFQTGMYEMTLVLLAKSFSMIHLGTFDIFSINGIKLAIGEINRMFAFAFTFCFTSIFYRIYFGCLLWLWYKVNASIFSIYYNFSVEVCFNIFF